MIYIFVSLVLLAASAALYVFYRSTARQKKKVAKAAEIVAQEQEKLKEAQGDEIVWGYKAVKVYDLKTKARRYMHALNKTTNEVFITPSKVKEISGELVKAGKWVRSDSVAPYKERKMYVRK
jgi:hypothetical protein